MLLGQSSHVNADASLVLQEAALYRAATDRAELKQIAERLLLRYKALDRDAGVRQSQLESDCAQLRETLAAAEKDRKETQQTMIEMQQAMMVRARRWLA